MGWPRQRRLAAVLLIHRNRVVSVDRLAEAVFAGEPTARAATTLRRYAARIAHGEVTRSLTDAECQQYLHAENC